MSKYFITFQYQSSSIGLGITCCSCESKGELITCDELKAVQDDIADQLGPTVSSDDLVIMFFTKIADDSQVRRTNLDKLLETHRELVIDCISDSNTNIAVFPNGEVVACDGDKDCEDCIFFHDTDSCIDAARKWLKKECED